MNKRLETALCCGRRKTDPPADISAENNIPRLPHKEGQRHPSPLPILARQQLTPSPLPTRTSPIIRSVTTNKEIRIAKRREKKTRKKKRKFKLLFIHEKLCREKTKGRRKPRQVVYEINNLVINKCEWLRKLPQRRTAGWLTSWHEVSSSEKPTKSIFPSRCLRSSPAPGSSSSSNCWHELPPPTPPNSQPQLTVVRSCCSPPPSVLQSCKNLVPRLQDRRRPHFCSLPHARLQLQLLPEH